MGGERKSLRGLKTMGSLVDGRRVRTSSGALLELSILANEKERLNKELSVAARRQEEIVARLSEIAEKEQRLHTFVKNPEMVAKVSQTPLVDITSRVKAKEFSY
jgi:hypothetical protein